MYFFCVLYVHKKTRFTVKQLILNFNIFFSLDLVNTFERMKLKVSFIFQNNREKKQKLRKNKDFYANIVFYKTD